MGPSIIARNYAETLLALAEKHGGDKGVDFTADSSISPVVDAAASYGSADDGRAIGGVAGITSDAPIYGGGPGL